MSGVGNWQRRITRSDSLDPETRAIRQVAPRRVADVANAGPDALARSMTDDIDVVHGDGRTIEGRDGVLADTARSLQDFRVGLEIDFEETVVANDRAFDRTIIHLTIAGRG